MSLKFDIAPGGHKYAAFALSKLRQMKQWMKQAGLRVGSKHYWVNKSDKIWVKATHLENDVWIDWIRIEAGASAQYSAMYSVSGSADELSWFSGGNQVFETNKRLATGRVQRASLRTAISQDGAVTWVQGHPIAPVYRLVDSALAEIALVKRLTFTGTNGLIRSLSFGGAELMSSNVTYNNDPDPVTGLFGLNRLAQDVATSINGHQFKVYTAVPNGNTVLLTAQAGIGSLQNFATATIVKTGDLAVSTTTVTSGASGSPNIAECSWTFAASAHLPTLNDPATIVSTTFSDYAVASAALDAGYVVTELNNGWLSPPDAGYATHTYQTDVETAGPSDRGIVLTLTASGKLPGGAGGAPDPYIRTSASKARPTSNIGRTGTALGASDTLAELKPVYEVWSQGPQDIVLESYESGKLARRQVFVPTTYGTANDAVIASRADAFIPITSTDGKKYVRAIVQSVATIGRPLNNDDNGQRYTLDLLTEAGIVVSGAKFNLLGYSGNRSLSTWVSLYADSTNFPASISLVISTNGTAKVAVANSDLLQGAQIFVARDDSLATIIFSRRIGGNLEIREDVGGVQILLLSEAQGADGIVSTSTSNAATVSDDGRVYIVDFSTNTFSGAVVRDNGVTIQLDGGSVRNSISGDGNTYVYRSGTQLKVATRKTQANPFVTLNVTWPTGDVVLASHDGSFLMGTVVVTGTTGKVGYRIAEAVRDADGFITGYTAVVVVDAFLNSLPNWPSHLRVGTSLDSTFFKKLDKRP